MDRVPVENLWVSSYTLPTATPEADGTLDWDKTTIVVVEVAAAGCRGVGYTYCSKAAEYVVNTVLRECVVEADALRPDLVYVSMTRSIRNLGPAGIGTMALSAVDVALWDLKAKILGQPLAVLLGIENESVEVYGSGGFTNYGLTELVDHCLAFARDGYRKVKIKVGRKTDEDLKRVHEVKSAIGSNIELFVDANGAYDLQMAIRMAYAFSEVGDVSWFEEPVSSEKLQGLKDVRDASPDSVAIAAGEYGHSPGYFRTMLRARAVDILQADATRCGGITGFLAAAAVCREFSVPLSAHCAPAMHAHLGVAIREMIHIEDFYDHVRIERALFDGTPVTEAGRVSPDLTRPGMGLELKRQDAERFLV